MGKAKRAHQSPQAGGHGAQERAFAHPTNDAIGSKSALGPAFMKRVRAAAADRIRAPGIARCHARDSVIYEVYLEFEVRFGVRPLAYLANIWPAGVP